MAIRTRRIGLLPGTDTCWPACLEALLERLDPAIACGSKTLRFEIERIPIEPFNLREPCRYDLAVDRLSHWYRPSREWIKKAVLTDDLYVFNDPWSQQSMDKHTTCCALLRLGFPVPATWLIPPKAYVESAEIEPVLRRHARLFDLGGIGGTLGYPLFLKPGDRQSPAGVRLVRNREALLEVYDGSGTSLMHLQKAIEGSESFVRCLGVGPQWRPIRYDPKAPPPDRYRTDVDFLSMQDENRVADMAMVVNAFFGWDFNACESLYSNGTWFPIDYAGAPPDARVTSLHCHFPWLVKAMLRWSLYCAATERSMALDHGWQQYFRIADEQGSFGEKLDAYVGIAQRHFEADRFYEFCEQHLGDLDEAAAELFDSDLIERAIREEVQARFPARDTGELVELFRGRIEAWRAGESGDGN